ncbi:MAG: hypothetical protein WD069_20330 [Planctomycetales bacterium]
MRPIRCRRFWPALLALLLLASAGPALAAPPETLLAEESAVYLRYDGLKSHRPAYEKTTLAGLLENEFGPLWKYVATAVQEALGPEALSEQLLRGGEPDELLAAQASLKQLPQLWDYLDRHGVALGAEINDPNPAMPQWQITFVFPDAKEAADRDAVLAGFRVLAMLTESEVKEIEREKRKVMEIVWGVATPIAARCWQEGDHVLLTIGSQPIEHTLALVDGKRKSLSANPALARLAGFKQYDTYLRGFGDTKRIFELVPMVFPPGQALLDEFGLSGLHGFAFHLGFEGTYQRSTVFVEAPEPRKGLLQLLAAPGEASLADLPPLPPDTVSAAVSRFDFERNYDAILAALDTGLKLVDPNAPSALEAVKEFETAAGIDLRKDLFAALGSNVAVYSGASEGPLMLGMTFAVEVRDEAQALASIEKLLGGMRAATGTDISVRTKKHGETDLHIVRVAEQGFPFAITYAVRDKWLVTSFYPQPVMGFLDRAAGKLTTWKVPAEVERLVQEARGDAGGVRVTSIQVGDPRPSVSSVLSIAPFFGSLVGAFSGQQSSFDVSMLPNSQAVVEKLTHNVTVAVDDGKSLRFETYSSLPMPFNLNGVELYALASFAPLLFLGIGF